MRVRRAVIVVITIVLGACSAEPPEPRTYVVRQGDSLISVAEDLYGDGCAWPALREANGISQSKPLETGMVLHVPPRADARAAWCGSQR